jgi:Helicase HerA, central domain
MDIPKDKHDELIEILHKGNMLSNSFIKKHHDYALITNDYGPLYKFLESYPIFLAHAKRNIAVLNYQLLENPFPYPHHDDVRGYLSGPLKLGYVNQFDDMWGIDYDVFCLPTIIPGRVGSGKSHLLKYILIQIFRRPRDFNVVIPDLKGNEYRNLLPYCKSLKIITKQNININPLQPLDCMTPVEQIIFFCKAFTRANFLMSTSEGIIIDILEEIYKKRGIFDGSVNWPTLRDLNNEVSYMLANEKKSFRYRDVLLLIQNRLDPYIYSGNFDCRAGIPHDMWRTENVVLELGKGFTDNMYSFLVSYIAGARYHSNMDMGLLGSKLRTLLVIDEGRLLFPDRDKETYGESYITELATRFRDPGIGLILASHEISSFNQTIRSVSFTKVCFPLTDGEDVSAVQKSFDLNDDQASHLFKLPRHGQAIVRYGGYPDPFILAVPHLNLKKTVSDEEVEDRMFDFNANIQEKMKIFSVHVQQKFDPVPPNAASLLYFLGKNPFTKTSEMINAAGFHSPAEVSRTLEWLEKNNFVIREPYKVSKRGRKAIFAVLNDKALRYLGIKSIPGKGSFEHKLYQHIICEKRKVDGLEAKIEGRIRGSEKSIDVLVRSEDGSYIAYEVTLHFDNLLSSSIRHDLATGVSKVVIVTRDNPDLEKAKKLVAGYPLLAQNRAKVAFCLISDFFD